MQETNPDFGSSENSEERLVAGTNGVGSTLTNIFSKEIMFGSYSNLTTSAWPVDPVHTSL